MTLCPTLVIISMLSYNVQTQDCDVLDDSESISLLQVQHALHGTIGNNKIDSRTIETDEYYWPSGTGRIEHYTQSSVTGLNTTPASLDLGAGPSWNWTDPRGRYRGVPNAVNIDDEKNIFMLTLDGIRKFSADGNLLWSYLPDWRKPGEEMPDTSSLYQGAVYVSTTHGHVVAISMDDGTELWKTKLPSCDGNNGWVSVSEGTVILGSNVSQNYRGIPIPGRYADQSVTGLNASDGTVMWNFEPDAPVWNFMGSFAGDGTFTFQDYEGKAYRNRVRDGTNIWKQGGALFSWTDGSSMLGPALSPEESLHVCGQGQPQSAKCRVVYAVNNRDPVGGRDKPGDVSAYRLEDGKLLWRKEVPRPPNNMPAVGRLAGKTGLSLVQPIGQQCQKGNPTDVYALDALTGELQWIFNGPSQKEDLQAGDSNPIAQQQRKQSGVREITLPNPWSAPTVDANGVVFIGSEEGGFYSLLDADGDGNVTGNKEVSVFDTGACFSGSSAPAIAPGMLIATSIDAMYVYKV